MLAIALALALTQYPQHRLFKQPSLPTASFAFFEAFPASGAGTTTACSTTAPTGARGEALTFTRTGSATCTKTATGGLATTGIADGDLVVMSGNQPRVEYDSAGTLGLLVESSRTNVLLQSATISNAVYSDVATPTLTGSQTDPFGTTTAVQVDDNDAAAFEGRQQTVTTTAGQPYTMHCYVKGGTATTARISIDGTTQDITGLSTSTWSIVERTDASASGASVVAQVLVGNATTVTGTVIWGGCQVELGSYRTSYIATAGAAASRNAEVPTVNGNALGFPTARYSLAASVQLLAGAANLRGIVEGQVGATSGVGFFTVAGFLRTQNLTAGADNLTDIAWSPVAGQLYRLATLNDGANQSQIIDGTVVVGPAAKTPPDSPWSATTGIGYGPSLPAQLDGIISRICIDSSPTRCR